MCQCVSEVAVGSIETCVSEGVRGTVRAKCRGRERCVSDFQGQWCDRCPQTAAVENRRSRSLMMDELESLSVWVKVWLMLRGFGTEVGRVGGFGDVSGDPPLRAAG